MPTILTHPTGHPTGYPAGIGHGPAPHGAGLTAAPRTGPVRRDAARTAAGHEAAGALVGALERFGPLPEAERRAVEQAVSPAKHVEAGLDLVRGGERASAVAVLLDGIACRHRMLEDGWRQITAFHVPGDLFDVAGVDPGRRDHGTCTPTPARVASVPRAALLGRAGGRPCLSEALWRLASIAATVSREWVVDVGRRTARARTAHLLCEPVVRLHPAGSVHGCVHTFPLTRAGPTDALGLTPAHVGRVVRHLRAGGLIELAGGVLAVHDWRGLKRAGGFDAGYLHRGGAAAWNGGVEPCPGRGTPTPRRPRHRRAPPPRTRRLRTPPPARRGEAVRGHAADPAMRGSGPARDGYRPIAGSWRGG